MSYTPPRSPHLTGHPQPAVILRTGSAQYRQRFPIAYNKLYNTNLPQNMKNLLTMAHSTIATPDDNKSGDDALVKTALTLQEIATNLRQALCHVVAEQDAVHHAQVDQIHQRLTKDLGRDILDNSTAASSSGTSSHNVPMPVPTIEGTPFNSAHLDNLDQGSYHDNNAKQEPDLDMIDQQSDLDSVKEESDLDMTDEESDLDTIKEESDTDEEDAASTTPSPFLKAVRRRKIDDMYQ